MAWLHPLIDFQYTHVSWVAAVVEGRGLAPKDMMMHTSDPYVRMRLLDDQHRVEVSGAVPPHAYKIKRCQGWQLAIIKH